MFSPHILASIHHSAARRASQNADFASTIPVGRLHAFVHNLHNRLYVTARVRARHYIHVEKNYTMSSILQSK